MKERRRPLRGILKLVQRHIGGYRRRPSGRISPAFIGTVAASLSRERAATARLLNLCHSFWKRR